MLGLALTAPALLRARPAFAAEGHPLALPALDEGQLEGGLRRFDLRLAAGESEFLAGRTTETWGINAPFLGPVLRIRAGERVLLNVSNGLGEAAALHWHGLHLPAAMDGGPHQSILPGATWSPEFPLLQRAGTFWFHAHQHGATAAHVWAGLAGAFRIEDDEEEALPLPRTYGEDDFILILQDRRFDADGQMPYAPDMHDLMSGKIGDVMLVNGQAGAHIATGAPRVRLRVLNGANGSIYRLHFSDGRPFHQIASDGGLLAAPVLLTEVLVAPGERAELVVDLHEGAPLMLRAEVFGAESPFAGPVGTRDVIELRPARARAPAPALTDRLAELPAIPGADGETRTFTLAMSGTGMMGEPQINGLSYDHGRIDFAVPLGATETWVFENRTEMLHPMHVHDVQFRILSRNGAPPAPHEAGWKDTVLTRPGERVEVRMQFADYADPLSPYMMHCHILEHEDAGMMQQFTVV
jgi:FtsP/CotA-like multicopper oxidase with cupredoxin domain